jgi:hypothetical protein
VNRYTSWRCPAGLLGAFLLLAVCVPTGGEAPPGAGGSRDVLLNLKDGLWLGKTGIDGFLDETLFFQGEADGEAARLRIRISQATSEDGSDHVPLFLVRDGDAALLDAGAIEERQTAVDLPIAPRKRTSVRLVSGHFKHTDKLYRARLVAETLDSAGRTARSFFYLLRIDPQFPLGLKAQELEPEDQEISPFSGATGSLQECIQTRAHAASSPDIVILPPNPAVEGARPLLPSQVAGEVNSVDCQDGLLVRFQKLPRGRYASLLKINGEPLLVKLTFKHHWLVVPAIILFGAILSMFIRVSLSLFQRRSKVLSRISGIEEMLKQRDRLTVWDDLRARNALRRAEGLLGLPEFPELDSALEAAERPLPERPETTVIGQALTGPLPRDVKEQIDGAIRAITRTSSASDERRVAELLGGLKKRAEKGFNGEVQAWMGVLKEALEIRKKRIYKELNQAPVTGRTRNLLDRAMTTLEHEVGDAEYLARCHVTLDPKQISLLEAVPGTLDAFMAEVRMGLADTQLFKIVHGDLDTGRDRVRLIQTPVVPAGLRAAIGVVDPPDGKVTPLDPVTFEVTFTPSLSAAELESLDIFWEVDGESRIRGGQRLTYLYSDRKKKKSVVSVTIELSGTARQPLRAEWSAPLSKRRSASRRSTSQFWIARQAASFIAVAIASLVTVALYWSDKPFGRVADYVSMIAIGLGADSAVVAGGGQLMAKILDVLGVGSKSEGKA